MKKKFNPKFKITQSILNNLMQIEESKGFLKAARLSSQWIKKMSRNAMLLETHHTTHIEGTQLTFEESKKILAGKQILHANKHDVKEVLNYKDAFHFVSKYLKTKSDIKESMIKAIHKELVKGVRGGSAKPGKYRDVQNYVVNARTRQIIYTPPSPKQVPMLMKDFVEWINQESEIHPVLKSGIIQFQFVHIHPFIDGNGRTSRLLSTFHLYKSGYDFKRLFSISEYYDKDRPHFYRAIQSVRENNMDMTGWLSYFVKGFLFQMNEVIEVGKKVIFKDALIKNYSLSERQGIIVEHILDNKKLLPKDFEALLEKMGTSKKGTHQITKRTLQRDLKNMIDKKVLETKGKTNDKSYHLCKEL